MLVGIECRECLDPQQGGKKQGLKAATQRLLAVMQQGKVVVRMRRLIGLYRLLELGYHRAKGPLVVEPLGKQMHAHTRQMGRDPDDLCARGNRPMAFSLMRASLTAIEPPGGPPPVDMAQAHRNQYLPVGGLVEEDPAWAHRVLLEQAPPQGLLNFAQLSSSRKGWTCLFSELTLAWGKEHAFILPIRTVQEEVCTFALTGQWPFLSSTKPVD